MKSNEEIIQWYKKQGVYDDFANEIARQHGITPEEFIANGYHAHIVTAFSWNGSIKGADYWANINTKFLEWLNSEEDTPQSAKEIDWEQRRYEIAKDAMCALSCGLVVGEADPNFSVSWVVEHAVTLTDALINELKKNKEE